MAANLMNFIQIDDDVNTLQQKIYNKLFSQNKTDIYICIYISYIFIYVVAGDTSDNLDPRII